jgi:16S rRNA (cytidine1402-2'-O)-methyltransferase
MKPPAPPLGRLLLVPNTLDLGAAAVDVQDLLPLGVLRQAARLQHWVVEDARSARAFLKRVDAVVPLAQPLQALQMQELPRPRKGSPQGVPAAEWAALLQPALAGHDVGLLSEAGLPAVADPGSALVQAAHAAGVVVQPLAGASSLLLALAASGLNGQSFAFVGYLPQEAAARAARIRELETHSRRWQQTQIAIEAPYRNAALLDALLASLQPGTQLSVSSGLTGPLAWTHTASVADWRTRRTGAQVAGMNDREPAVFSWLA